MNSAKTDDTTAPGTVTGLGGTPGDGRVTLAWADPPDADLASIEITWTPDGTAPQTVARGAGTYTAAGLTNGTAYTFTVKAVDEPGNRSGGVSTGPHTPAAVTGLSAAAGKEIVRLTWTDPTDADLASIEITWTPGGTAPQTVARGAGTYTAAGLTNGTAYAFTVKAKDAAWNLSAGVPGTALTANSWVTGTINLPYEVHWYKFTAATYYVQWDDASYEGSGTYTGYVRVSAYRANGTLVFSDIYNGYSSPRFFSASVNETIYKYG